MQYYGTRLSENISKREPQGYLLCLNVPVARTGTQEYLPEELGLISGVILSEAGGGVEESSRRSGASPGLIPVYRPEEEVFSPETMASFEGMPVTNDHPPEGVDVSNIRALQKGHAHNVRRGSGEESDLLLADLIITDPDLIDAILVDGKREISCGYTYELCEENGRFIQRKIRGNHVAVVDVGRAGPRVCIKDEHPVPKPGIAAAAIALSKSNKTERRKTNMKKSLSKVLARIAKDGDVETVAEILEEMMEPDNNSEFTIQNSELPKENEVSEAVEEVGEDPAAVVETPAGTTVVLDEASLAGVLERLDRIIALLEPPAMDESTEQKIMEGLNEISEEELGMTHEAAEALEQILSTATSVTPGPGEEENAGLLQADKAAFHAALDAVNPFMATLTPKQRIRIIGDIALKISGARDARTADPGLYGVLASAQKRSAPVSADLGRKIMAKRNSNYRK